MIWVLLAGGLLMLLVLLTGFLMARFAMSGGKRQTLEEARAWQAAHYDLSWLDALRQEPFTVRCRDGYILHGLLLRGGGERTRCVVISHGYTDNRWGAMKYARIYLDRGYDVVVYDLRGHGENARTFCTYSVREGHDLADLLGQLQREHPEYTLWGLQGESLGSASTAACLGEHPRVAFAVADCGFSEIRGVLEAGVRGMHLPGWMTGVASLCAKIRYGYSFGEMRPVDRLRGNTVPLLLIHGADDTFILPRHSEALRAATSGPCRLVLIPGAGHAASVLTDPEAYGRAVTEFLRENHLPTA